MQKAYEESWDAVIQQQAEGAEASSRLGDAPEADKRPDTTPKPSAIPPVQPPVKPSPSKPKRSKEEIALRFG